MLTAKVTTSIVVEQTGTGDLETPQVDLAKSYVENYSDGTAVDQAQKHFSDTRTLAGSASESLDLSGSLVGPLGTVLAFTAIKEIVISAAKTNTGDLRLGKKIANGFAGPFDQTAGSLGVTISPGGCHRLSNPTAAGWPVTAATADLLSVENLSAGSSDYDIVILGEG